MDIKVNTLSVSDYNTLTNKYNITCRSKANLAWVQHTSHSR